MGWIKCTSLNQTAKMTEIMDNRHVNRAANGLCPSTGGGAQWAWLHPRGGGAPSGTQPTAFVPHLPTDAHWPSAECHYGALIELRWPSITRYETIESINVDGNVYTRPRWGPIRGQPRSAGGGSNKKKKKKVTKPEKKHSIMSMIWKNKTAEERAFTVRPGHIVCKLFKRAPFNSSAFQLFNLFISFYFILFHFISFYSFF